MTDHPIQDTYDRETAICYGCGQNNPNSLGIRTYFDGEEGVCHFTPRPEHTAFPGVVYGGLIASLIDCHSIGTAIAAMYQAEGRQPGTDPEITCVTGNLNISFLKPTPTGVELVLRTHILELTEKKAVVACDVFAGDDPEPTVEAETIAVRVRARRIE